MQTQLSIAAVVVGLTWAPVVVRAQSPVSIDRAIRAEAARLAAGLRIENSPPSATGPQRAGLSVWASLAGLNAGSDVLVTRSGAAPGRYRLLSVSDDGLTLLDLSSPAIPGSAARALRREASSRPGSFSDARGGREVALTDRVIIGPAGVSQQGRLLCPLSLVVVDVPRPDVAEVSVIRKHVGQHAKRGAVIGAVAGVVLIGAGLPSCDDCGSPVGWLMAGAIGGASVGLEYGTIVGLIVPRSPDLIYRR